MVNYSYVKEFLQNRYRYALDNCCIKKDDNDIKYKIYNDAICLPVVKKEGMLFGAGGVLDNNGEFVDDSSTFSCASYVEYGHKSKYVGGRYDIDDGELLYSNENIIYMGYIKNHWGHFIVDFSSRFWIYKSNLKNYKYAFIVNKNKNFTPINQIKEFFKYIGMDNNVLFVNKPTKFNQIIIPEQSYITNYYYSNKYIDIFNCVAENALKYGDYIIDCPDKIYFTRSNYKKAVKSEFGEDMIINILEKNGFTIFSPENLTLAQQIYYIRNCKILCGISGTIMHNIVFSDMNHDNKFIILNKTYNMNMMQMDFNIMMNANVEYIDCYTSMLPTSLGNGPFLLMYTKELDKYIKDNNFIGPDDQYNKFEYKKNIIEEYISKINITKIINNEKSVHYFSRKLLDDFINYLY